MDNYSTTLALLNLFLPFLSFIILIFFGKKFSASAHWIALALIGSSLGIAVSFFANVFVSNGQPILETSVRWFSAGSFFVNLGFLINNEAAIMLLVVALISFLVHFYSVGYMQGDARYSRYFAYLGIFTFSMNGIVLADSLLMMYIFWELVGLSSYLLIGFWFEKVKWHIMYKTQMIQRNKYQDLHRIIIMIEEILQMLVVFQRHLLLL